MSIQKIPKNLKKNTSEFSNTSEFRTIAGYKVNISELHFYIVPMYNWKLISKILPVQLYQKSCNNLAVYVLCLYVETASQ